MAVLELTADLANHRAAFLALEQAASEPYGTFVFGDANYARRVRDFLFEAGACEFAPPDGRLALSDGVPCGMVACVPGDLLRDYRAQATEELAESELLAADPDLIRRLAMAADTLLRPEDDDLYLSRIAVDLAFQRQGVADFLMQHLLTELTELSCKRCVLEVASDAVPALRLYAKHGFTAIGERNVHDPQTGRALAYRHMARVT